MTVHHSPDAMDAFELSELMFPTTALCISVATRHGVADVLADGRMSGTELAGRTGTDAVQLRKVLRLLAEERVFCEVGPDLFENTRLSHLLRAGVPRSQHAMAELVGEQWLWNAWGRLADGVATGRAGFEIAHGTTLWAHLATHPEAGRVFNDAMDGFSEALGDQVAVSYPEFARSGVIADLGGGTGTFLHAILRTYPEIGCGILMDLGPVVEQARTAPELAPLVAEGRMRLHPGDFLEEVPAGVDTYVVKQIMHSWDDARVTGLLRRCRAASPQAGFVAAEFVHDDKASKFVKNFDLVMSVTMNGNVRTADQYAELFRAGGYELSRVVPTGTAFSLVEARPLP